MPTTDSTHLLIHEAGYPRRRYVQTLADFLLGYIGAKSIQVRALLPGERVYSGALSIECVTCRSCDGAGESSDGSACSQCCGDGYDIGCDDCGEHVDAPGACGVCAERRERELDARGAA
jgi:RecJ-like exonuclease